MQGFYAIGSEPTAGDAGADWAPVESDFAASYAVNAFVSSDLSGAYVVPDQPGVVNSDLAGSYVAFAFVESSLAADYIVNATVDSDLAGSYGVGNIDLPDSRIFDLRAERRIYLLKM